MARDVPLHLAIDLGAGSGRAIVGALSSSGVVLREAHRFHYEPRPSGGRLRWNFEALTAGIKDGIRASMSIAKELGGSLQSSGVDSWGVDYGLLDENESLIEEPISYRDSRTDGVIGEVIAIVGRDDLFARTGIQLLPFNTIYQLLAHVRDGVPANARHLLMIPDLCHHMLCGSLAGEYTNATTTQLLSATNGQWDTSLFERLRLPLSLMPPVVAAGTTLGKLRPRLCDDLGVPPLSVVAPATHDTGSAVLGTPLNEGWAYISSGTWSLVGVERDAPVINAASAAANFTNEGGAFGTVRFLKNVMGLWIVERCRREWEEAGQLVDYDTLLARVAAARDPHGLIFPDDPRFFNPASMTAEIRAALIETGQQPIDDPVLIAKTVLDSLALRYASVLDTIETLTGRRVPGIHIVGGGSLNAYLNQATADAAMRPVLAGPVEATAYGNVLAQAIACGEIASLSEGRELLSQSLAPRRFEPRDTSYWKDAAERYREIDARVRA